MKEIKKPNAAHRTRIHKLKMQFQLVQKQIKTENRSEHRSTKNKSNNNKSAYWLDEYALCIECISGNIVSAYK